MKRRHRSTGFTLVEMITAMTLVAVLLAVVAPLIASGMTGYSDAATHAELAASASAAMERLTDELRSIPLRSSPPARPAIDAVSENALSWSRNSGISLSGGNLRLALGGAAARTLAENVTAFSIQALDEDDAPLTLPISGAGCDAVRRLSLTLTLTRGPVSETLRTRVFLRSMAAGAAP